MNIEELIRRGRLINAAIEDMEAKQKEELRPLQEARKAYYNTIQEIMIANKTRYMKTSAGGANLVDKTSYRVEDQSEYKRHVIGSEDWDMLVWAVKRSAAETFEQQTGRLPPGVAKSTVLDLRLLAPERKRVKKPDSVQTEGEQTFDAFGDEPNNEATPENNEAAE